MLREPN
jgi:hypothetical protein